MKSVVRLFLLYGGMFLGLFACKSYEIPVFDTIVFEYQDSSLEAEFKRNYTITIQKEQRTVVVTSYKKSIANKTYKLSKEQFINLENLAKTLESPGVHDQKEPGGSSKRIRLLRKERNVYGLIWDHNYTPKKTTLEFEKTIKNLVPDLDKLLLTPYKESVQ